MTDHAVTPFAEITIAGTTYPLDCSFRTLEAIQRKRDADIVDVLVGCMSLRFDEAAELLHLGLTAAAPLPLPLDEVKRAVLEDIGLLEARFAVAAWLSIAVTPKRDREKKARELADAHTRLQPDSRGTTT